MQLSRLICVIYLIFTVHFALPALFVLACQFIRRTLSLLNSNFTSVAEHVKAQFTTEDERREHLPLDDALRSRKRVVAGVVPRRRPLGVVPRDPNSLRTCPWSSLPPSLRLLDGSSPVENGVSRTSCPPAFMTRLLNFSDTQSCTREV